MVQKIGFGLSLCLFSSLVHIPLFGALADPALGGSTVIVRADLFTGKMRFLTHKVTIAW